MSSKNLGRWLTSRGILMFTETREREETAMMHVPHPLTAQCRGRSGSYVVLDVLNISASGCLVDRKAWSAKPDDRILIRLEGLGYQPATVIWVEDDQAGIAFEQMLYEPVAIHMKQRLAGPLRKAS